MKLELSAFWTIVGVLLLFSGAVGVTLIAPEYIDPSWKQASSTYQVQMYEVSDPHVYISTANPLTSALRYVYHLRSGFTLHAFQESSVVRILASEELDPYVTHVEDDELKLTSRVLLLRKPLEETSELQKKLQAEWKGEHPPFFEIYELFDPQKEEAFAITQTDGIIENWKEGTFTLLGQAPPYNTDHGTIYVNNPMEFKVREKNILGTTYELYDENGEPLQSLTELREGKRNYISRQELIKIGEDIFRIEGCWYCHTDQTRTLVQDTVLNGSASYPAPPSSANEYIYQRVTFPGTRRIGPDLSRVGVKRPHRDWHISHFWEPKSESKGTIMPAFKHFFDADPAGSIPTVYGLPNYKFEAVYQYLMTKGTRITPPTQAWWLGLDPIQTIDIIEGNK